MYNLPMPKLLHSTRLPWPTPWQEIFGREAPLLVEIGFGGGHFLVELGKKRPDCNVLGIEISLPSLRRGEKKIETAALSNARVVQGNAQVGLQALCQPDSVAELYINFPDPWPKAAHQRRRLINDDFLHLAATRMPTGGLLEIATDHAEYAAVISQVLERNLYFENRLPSTFTTQDDQRLRTKYEMIAIEQGRTCHYFKWRRNDKPAPNRFLVPKEFPMPHVIIRSPMSMREIGQNFKSMNEVRDNTLIKLMEVFQSYGDQTLLVETYVNESPLSQRVGLTIRQRRTGEFVVGLHEIGFPRPTAGIQLAIKRLADWVVGLSPDSEILQSNLKIDAVDEQRL